MREKQCKQMPILIPSMEHPRAEEQQPISDIRGQNPILSEMIRQDLTNLLPCTAENPVQQGILSAMMMVVFS